MQKLHTLLEVPHYVCGFLALASFWVPMLARKGGSLHRRAGLAFALSMLLTSATSFGMAAIALAEPELIHPERSAAQSRVSALFLTYLGLVSVAIVHNGWALARLKRDVERLRASWRLALNYAALAGSVAALAYGLVGNAILLAALSPVGVLAARSYRRALKAAASDKTAWLSEHIATMVMGGIAVHTAFLAGGGTRFLPAFVAGLGWGMWLVPTAIGVPAIVLLQRRYRRGGSA